MIVRAEYPVWEEWSEMLGDRSDDSVCLTCLPFVNVRVCMLTRRGA